MRLSSAKFFLRRLFGRRGLENELREEIESHLAMDERLRLERNDKAGDAREASLREFGNVDLIKEVTRDMWGLSWLEQAAQDARFAARTFLKTPVFTVVAVAVLALSIGGATAIFAAVYSILLRPLGFPDPGQLVTIWEMQPQMTKPNVVALNNFVEWKRDSHSFQSMAAFVQFPMNVLSGGESEQVPGLHVTADFFQVLGTQPLLGRTFRPGEYDRDAPREVVLSYETWQSRFGGRRDVIGKRISIDVSHHRIIGVMPPGFGIPGVQARLYVPLAINLQEGRNYSVIARLRGGISANAAKSEIAVIAEHTAKDNPVLDAGWSATVIPLLDYAVGAVRPVLLVLFAAVGLLLLIACSNIANLLLMRSAHRTREISVRLALGAGPARIVRQLIVESLLLSAVGGLLGIGLALISVRVMAASLPSSLSIPRTHEIRMDETVCAFSIGVTLLAGLLFGIAPALQALRTGVVENLRAASRSVTSCATLRRSLVVAEVALASILVAAAGLMTRSFLRLTRVDPGFHPEHVLTVRMLLLPVRKEEWHAEMVDQMLDKIRALPGILAAGSIGILPMMGGNSGTWYYRADRPEPALNRRPVTDVSIITPGYFRAMGIPILEGRDFDGRDRTGAPRVAILNQTAARSLFPAEDPVGKRVRVWWNSASPLEILGIAADIRHSQLNTPPDPCLFMPNDQAPFPFSSLVIRTIGDPGNLAPAIREQIRQVDSDQGVAEVESMRQLIADSVARPRLETLLLSGFGFGALLLACIGTYGVIAYSVTQRMREIGIRVALGATRLVVFRMVIGDGIRLTAAGVVIGLAGTALVTRYLRDLLFEIQPDDPLTLLAVGGLLALLALVACYFPAARAMRTDPAVVLREE
ncbi:MAG: ABC transporter permease [Bryobacteraceae bacterium]